MTVKRAALSAALAVALGLEIITPSGGEHPHVEKDVIAEPETVGSKADALRPVVTPPENPWLMGFTLRVTSPEELKGWWVNTRTTTAGGLVTVGRTQTCGEARFKETVVLRNPNLPGRGEPMSGVFAGYRVTLEKAHQETGYLPCGAAGRE